MDIHLFDRLWNIIDAILGNITVSIWLLFIVFAALSKLFKSRPKAAPDVKPRSATTYSEDSYRPRPEPVPSQSTTTMTESRKQAAPQPSVWTDRPADDGALSWDSPFENDDGKTKWGFDDSDWGSEFDRKKKLDEPKISVRQSH